MASLNVSRLLRHLGAGACLLSVLLLSSLALAYGTVQWKSTTLKERESSKGSWVVELTIVLGKSPDLPTIPAKFEFKQQMAEERFLDDAHPDPKNPAVRRDPTPNKPAIIESIDIGFLDPASGKVEKRTRFSFKITRAHGFEAGDWQVTITDSRNGSGIGVPTRLVLQGQNPIVDRRSMVFSDQKKREGKDDKKKDDEKKGGDAAGPATGGNQAASKEEEQDWPEVSHDEKYGHDPDLKGKHGACGCRAAGAPAGSAALVLLPAALVLGFSARRRRRAA
jgi:hypothetical protein